jgi:xanthine dehydrogenase molybdopterin-binding subunit B
VALTQHHAVRAKQDGVLFAADEVQYYGQPLGIVVADTQERASRAARLVKVDYEDLPAIITIEDGALCPRPTPPPQLKRATDLRVSCVVRVVVRVVRVACVCVCVSCVVWGARLGIKAGSFFETSPMFHDHVERGNVEEALKQADTVVEGEFNLGGALHWYPRPLPSPTVKRAHRSRNTRHRTRTRAGTWSRTRVWWSPRTMAAF